MSLSVSFRHSARAEFIEAAAWYESERQNLGVEFIAEIERCAAAAAERPMTYSAVYKDVRRVVAKRFPFSVYFRAESTPYRRFGRFPWQPGPRDLAAPDLTCRSWSAGPAEVLTIRTAAVGIFSHRHVRTAPHIAHLRLQPRRGLLEEIVVDEPYFL